MCFSTSSFILLTRCAEPDSRRACHCVQRLSVPSTLQKRRKFGVALCTWNGARGLLKYERRGAELLVLHVPRAICCSISGNAPEWRYLAPHLPLPWFWGFWPDCHLHFSKPSKLLLPLSLSLPILPWCVKSGYRKRESIDAPAAAFLFPSLVERGLGASCWRGKTPAPRADCPIGHTQLQPVTGRGTDSDSCPSPLPSLSRALGQPAERHTPDNVIQGSRRAEWVPSGRKPELSVTTVSPDASQLPLHHPASVSARRRVSHRSP
jgi:hypothetical protein